MAIVKVFANQYVNPSWVGKVEFAQRFEKESRTSTTRVFDNMGQDTLFVLQTTVSTPAPPSDPDAVKRDNFVHAEIVAALSECRHARTWTDEMSATTD